MKAVAVVLALKKRKPFYMLFVPAGCDPLLVCPDRLFRYWNYRKTQKAKLERWLDKRQEEQDNIYMREVGLRAGVMMLDKG